MRQIELWSKPTDYLTEKDIVVIDTIKENIPDDYFLKESGKRYQEAYNKNAVKIYRDYNLSNGPVDGFTLITNMRNCNLFMKEKDI